MQIRPNVLQLEVQNFVSSAHNGPAAAATQHDILSDITRVEQIAVRATDEM